jgi:hypothetical protein
LEEVLWLGFRNFLFFRQSFLLKMWLTCLISFAHWHDIEEKNQVQIPEWHKKEGAYIKAILLSIVT